VDKWPCSRLPTPYQKLAWSEQQQTEASRPLGKVSCVVRDERIRPAIDCRLKNHLIARIGKLGPPDEPDVDRLDGAGHGREDLVDNA
jgi:hypothetical protein